MTHLRRLALPALLAATALLSTGCTIVRVRGTGTGIASRGLIDGHVAVGMPEEDNVFSAEVFDGSSPGGLAEIRIWKLLRLEVGLLGASVGVGPLDVGVGALAYSPRPAVERRDEDQGSKPVPHEHGRKPEEGAPSTELVIDEAP